jgi:hypothetical protein
MLVSTRVLQNFLEPFVVVSNLKMKKFTEVVLITNIQCGEGDINAAA